MAKKRNVIEEPTPIKVHMINQLLDTIAEPWIFLCMLDDRLMSTSANKLMTREAYCKMLAMMMIMTAEANNTTPIKVLSAVGEAMSQLMKDKDEKHSRINKASARCTETSRTT